MRKIISLATIVVMLLTVSFMPTYATVNDIEEIEKENYIENHINDLLNGDVEPVKEDFNGNVSIALSEVEKADPLSIDSINNGFFYIHRRRNKACRAK